MDNASGMGAAMANSRTQERLDAMEQKISILSRELDVAFGSRRNEAISLLPSREPTFKKWNVV